MLFVINVCLSILRRSETLCVIINCSDRTVLSINYKATQAEALASQRKLPVGVSSSVAVQRVFVSSQPIS